MQVIIMAAGRSTRTYPLTLTRPKPLLPVMGEPLLVRQLEALEGIADEVILVIGWQGGMIRERMGDRFGPIRLRYVVQREQRGTGHAVLQCREAAGREFLVLNGDDLYDPADLRQLAAADRAALAREVPDPRLYGIYETDPDGRVRRLVEKPVEISSRLANIGAYRLGSEIFELLEHAPVSPRGEIELTDGIQALAERRPFHALTARGYWLPIGYPWHLLDANQFWLDHDLEPGIHGDVSDRAEIAGPVYIGPGTRVRSGAVIEGPVWIGPDCRIGPNCWIRPYTVLGRGCVVGHASEVKGSVLFDGARAPHQNYVGDSILGEGVNLGCGTITANLRHDEAEVRSMVGGALIGTGRKKLGAIVGDGVHTGINTSIYPGRKLWPGTVTRPGAVIDRDLVRGNQSATESTSPGGEPS